MNEAKNQPQKLASTELLNKLLCSGIGQFHSTDNKAAPQEYLGVTLAQIYQMAASPQSMAKEKAQWVIPSTLMSRVHAEQRERGEFCSLWADIDKNPDRSVKDLAILVFGFTEGAGLLAYTSRSATRENQKGRLIIPLGEPVSGVDYLLLQKILNDRLEALNIPPDRATERAAQLCYLPNRGEFYDFSILDGEPFNPLVTWKADIEKERRSEADRQRKLDETRERARLKAAQRVADGVTPIEAFNQAYGLEETILPQYGYQKRGLKWLPPHSDSKNPGFKVMDGNKWVSHHSSCVDLKIGQPSRDGKKTVWGDAFDLFVHFEHNGDHDAAVRAAAEMFDLNKKKSQTYSKNRVTGVTKVAKPESLKKSGYLKEKAEVTGVTEPKERPFYETHDEWFELDGENKKPGLYYHGAKKEGRDGVVFVDIWICSPIHAIAKTCDERGCSWGLLLSYQKPNGLWGEWAAPLHLLKGSGDELRGELLDQGVRIDPRQRNHLSMWLMNQYPEEQIVAALRSGWHDGPNGLAFVLPNRVIGASGIRFQSEHAAHDDFIQSGTLEGWKKEVAAPCSGNRVLIFGMSASFVGPLLKIAKLQDHGGAGLHLEGDSSRGKTTVLQCGASVWGAPGFVRTWRATANGLEATSAALNDTCLILDEISECSPHEIGAIVYSIANGHGKQRAKRTGGARESAKWRVFLLSSGERSIGAHMSEAGRKIKAGQEIRLLDVPVTNQKHGCFDELHGCLDGRAFADALKTATAKHYGHAGPLFVEKLLSDSQDLPGLLNQVTRHQGFHAKDGPEGRAASTFALVGLAGELAIEYGIAPWEQGAALLAAMWAFDEWRKFRGSGQTENRQVLQAVRDFILRHGDARFSKYGEPGASIRDRAGYWKDSESGRVYLFHTGALREAIPGYDTGRILDALDDAGWISERGQTKRAKNYKVDGRATPLYAISLGEGGEDELG